MVQGNVTKYEFWLLYQRITHIFEMIICIRINEFVNIFTHSHFVCVIRIPCTVYCGTTTATFSFHFHLIYEQYVIDFWRGFLVQIMRETEREKKKRETECCRNILWPSGMVLLASHTSETNTMNSLDKLTKHFLRNAWVYRNKTLIFNIVVHFHCQWQNYPNVSK